MFFDFEIRVFVSCFFSSNEVMSPTHFEGQKSTYRLFLSPRCQQTRCSMNESCDLMHADFEFVYKLFLDSIHQVLLKLSCLT